MATTTCTPIVGTLPCPFCGSQDHYLGFEPTREGSPKTKFTCWILCIGCAIHGPSRTVPTVMEAHDAARDAWNKRSENASPLPFFPSELLAHMAVKN